MSGNPGAFGTLPLDPISWGRFGLWSVAGLAMLSVHIGVGVWALRPPPAEPASPEPPAAIAIELAPETVAPLAQDEQITPQQTEAEAATAAQRIEATPRQVQSEQIVEVEPDVVEPPETPDQNPADEPPVEADRPEPDPAEQDDPVDEAEPPLEAVNLPIPRQRPAFTSRGDDTPRQARGQAVRAPQAASAASRQTPRAQIRARQAPLAAARETNRGAGRSISPARWQSRLLAHLERRKRYPSGARSRREQGTAHVRFSIDGNGNVTAVRLARSSGFPELDQEVVAMVRRASPVPAPPPGVNRTLTVPVRFRIR